MKPYRITAALLAAGIALGGASAQAQEFVVKMLNRGETGMMVFEPGFVKAQVGDTIRFVPTDKGHNAETIKGFLPEGATPIAGKTGKEVMLTLTKEGLYGIRCKPHYGLGMVALIEAGSPVNLDAVKAIHEPKKAAKKFGKWFEQL
ncbi:pseudoazurin [Thioclava atlantica]|uniref:Pseudoazurin n=1 Tax=Thioclava atlantica TaxID=1317124 RepID=A0A085U0Q8_9RHOB|nr:pseudoazurin [Thioclava atlantica]KFE36555.1 pseudoazurin [Thioclava atlantica]